MNSLVFFGSLRSKKLLKIIINNDLNHLIFHKAKIFKSKLFKVKNENFPYLEKINSNKLFVECTYIVGLTQNDLDKIIFYESIEYKLNKIIISINEKNIETNFFELIKKNKTYDLWLFEKWQKEFEDFSCIAAKEWMLLFEEYKNKPDKAEIFWEKMLNNADKQING